ncbi:MAG: citramalate synthase [Aeromicrobium sp.]
MSGGLFCWENQHERAEGRSDVKSVDIFDTTMRDGAQQEGLNLSVQDKLHIARHLDDLGVDFIEGGWPGAIPKDTEFFRLATTEIDFKHATLVAFGATRKANAVAAEDPQVLALRDSNAPVVCLVAKSHDKHVDLALRTTLEENLAMVRDTVEFLRSEGRRVFVDCEHFFNGYLDNPDYATQVVRTAADAGAEVVVLCDTNGGMLPHQVGDIVGKVLADTGATLGIHAQDDTGCAVANSIAAVLSGAKQVQGTMNGYGERTGNANLVSCVANLQLKLGLSVLPDGKLAEATRISHAVSEITNYPPDARQPYTGSSAFAHKAGLHASAIKVDPDLYQHIDPALVGNDMRLLVSEMAGRATIELRGRDLGYDMAANPEKLARVLDRVKEMEQAGYTFEAADASFELLLAEEMEGARPSYFDVESWRVIAESASGGAAAAAEATVKVRAGGERFAVIGEGNGPVNALDHALRQAIERVYPDVAQFRLTDFRVRILDQGRGTDSVTRVLIETTDGKDSWVTVGVGANIIEASWEALLDALTYGLRLHGVAVRSS